MTNEEGSGEIRYPSFYADQLNVHPNHLNAVVKRITGITATSIIQNQLVTSAKSLLRQTDLLSKRLLLNFILPSLLISTIFLKK